jgi:hypothetical protein
VKIITKSQVLNAFSEFITVLCAHNGQEEGDYSLDYSRSDGGYIIQELFPDNTGAVFRPFGDERLPARAMHERLQFCILVLDDIRRFKEED